MASERQGMRRGFVLLGIAAVAGLVAGALAVYVKQSADGNATASVDCAPAMARAAAVAPLATGEVAAFRVADRPDLLSDLTFRLPDGSESSVAAFAGKTILLNLWATWCVPCRAEMPALDRLQEQLGGDDFSVVAVNVDVSKPERARDFLDEIGVSRLAFYSDPTLRIFNRLKSRGLALGLPTTILLDARGCRIGGVEGPAAWDSEEAKALLRSAVKPG